MRKRTIKSVKRSCDKLWSLIIRLRDRGVCQKCGGVGHASHHLFGRRSLSTRWETDNGIFLCSLDHVYSPSGFEQSPYNKDNLRVITDKIGDKRFSELEIQSKQIVKRKLFDYLELEEELKKELSFYE